MDIYTSQLKYSGVDRLDITVKAQDQIGKHFAPTWEMVKGIKNGAISKELYMHAYVGILSQSLHINSQVWQGVRAI